MLDDLINDLQRKVGIDRATAERVATYLKEHQDEVPKWFGGKRGVSSRITEFFGRKK